MQYDEFIRNRITSLRINKNVSEYQMSLDLGHSKSYIQSISSGRALPSMSEFISICDYFAITPKDFFDDELKNPEAIQNAVDNLNMLSDEDLKLVLAVIERMIKK